MPVGRRVPREGATAWADSWLLAKQAKHPNCAYLWLRHVLTADVPTSRLSQGCAGQQARVEVERYVGTPPPVTVTEAPPRGAR